MPSSAAVASAPAKPLSFSDYVMRRKEGKREVWKVEREKQQERQRGSIGFSENKTNRDGERC